MMICVIL